MNVQEIVSTSEVFTQDELKRIDELATGKSDNITLDDMKLFSRWETSNALVDARFKAEIDALQQKTQADIENSKALNDQAVANLEAQTQLAYARLEVVKNGQESEQGIKEN